MNCALTLPGWLRAATASARYVEFRAAIELELAAKRPRELDEDDQSSYLLRRRMVKKTKVTPFKRERKAWHRKIK